MGKVTMSQTHNQPFNKTPKSKEEALVNSNFLPNIKSRNVGGNIYNAHT